MDSGHVDITGYGFSDHHCQPASKLLLPILFDYLEIERRSGKAAPTVFDLGCGNGAAANVVASRGFPVMGVDPSAIGVEHAHRAFPHLHLEQGSAYDDLRKKYGTFDVVYSFEVVEHVYDPYAYAKCLFDLVNPGGLVLVSTPYHGYLKNLVLAATGKLDDHFTALWPHGHIKFWSINTLSKLLTEAGFGVERTHRVGRIPALAKSMLMVARRPA
ncbi:class I SAM-dependent methyltransferase [Bradyrhizobium sp. 179]|uniref:class I SAM-dependent methyltransferase n=1 Tax=Bradyrhizobium sp. 179 TaxID=2782648 RepID=UPI001FFA93BF|nr:class I SAM-dependent methyltransferase [Bradyrhizobium sp. 179]MCK1546327.1 class I SAM-dependent methyltransferase [Bradyrhizobium sp. 179]